MKRGTFALPDGFVKCLSCKVISACEKGSQWQSAVFLLFSMPKARVDQELLCLLQLTWDGFACVLCFQSLLHLEAEG
jgi:hypothetical protein